MTRFQHVHEALKAVFGEAYEAAEDITGIHISLMSWNTVISGTQRTLASLSGEDADLFWSEMDRLAAESRKQD